MDKLQKALHDIKSIIADYEADPEGTDILKGIQEADTRIFTVLENNKKPGQPIFMATEGDNMGKVGFPDINGLEVQIGDTVRGKIRFEHENYFVVDVIEIVKRARK